jgi:hypothetical protein
MERFPETNLVLVLAVRRVMQLRTPAPIGALLNYFVIRGQTLPRPLEPKSPLRLHPINDCCRQANATCGAYDRKPIHVETPLEVSLA